MLTININNYNLNSKNPVFQDKVTYSEGEETFLFDVKLTLQGDNFLVEGFSEMDITLECSRCLEKTVTKQVISFMDLYIKNRSDREKLEDDFQGNIFIIEDGNINLADSIAAALEEQKISNLLCSEECKGLCPLCGTDLNKAKCNCSEDNIDPRFEALKNFKI